VSASLGSGRQRPRQALAEINITPMVDVMLVLLIISMIAAPMLQQGINLELPETVNATQIEDVRVVVSIDREGRIRINDKPVHEALLGDQMKGLAQASPDEIVYLQADKLLPYGEVLRVMDKIRSAGVTHVSLVTIPLELTEGSLP
jgi:biopolymer transport protein TolR